MVEANSAAEALQQIAYDLDSDPGAYDSDLQPIEDGVGEITITIENQCSYMTHALAVVIAEAIARHRVLVPIVFHSISRKLSEDEAYSGVLAFAKAGIVKIDFLVHAHAHLSSAPLSRISNR